MESAVAGSAAPRSVAPPLVADCVAEVLGSDDAEVAVAPLAVFCWLPELEHAVTEHAIATAAVTLRPTMAMDFILSIPSFMPVDPRTPAIPPAGSLQIASRPMQSGEP
jgi:hypothetical protein